METKTLIERAQLYNEAYAKYPPLVWTDRWVYGVWMIGNNYRNKNQYYGEYPPGYTPKRPGSNAMPRLPELEKDLPALAAYLAETAD